MSSAKMRVVLNYSQMKNAHRASVEKTYFGPPTPISHLDEKS